MYGIHGKREDYSKGAAAEALGLKMLRAYFASARVQATARGSEADRKGTDVYVNSTSVDIKAFKKHAPDHILVEHRNVVGGIGWAHRPGLVLIFVSATDAVLVDKKYLSLLINDARKVDWNRSLTQQPREYVEDFRPYGRPDSDDAVVYIPYAQLMRLITSKRLHWNEATKTTTEVKA